jgi:hypothetical protein
MDNEFKYVKWLNRGREALYSYKTDQFEEHNLAGSKPEVAERMRGILVGRLKEVNDRFSPKP